MRIYCDSVILIYLPDTVGPFRDRADARIAALRAAGDRIAVSDLSRRASSNFKLGDALHLAASIESGCDHFLTNDTRLSRCTDIAIEIPPP